MKIDRRCWAACFLSVILSFPLAEASQVPAAILEVGPGKPFARIEDANANAQPGDVILVYPLPSHRQYEKTAVFVRQKNLTFRGVSADGKPLVAINGRGFDYSGAGSTPRAIFQFNPGTDHCTLEGFELVGAHNSSHNGAGVRINQANHVTVRNCSIHGNDMGVMSNGDGTLARGRRSADRALPHLPQRRSGRAGPEPQSVSRRNERHAAFLRGPSQPDGPQREEPRPLHAGRVLLRASFGQSRVRPRRRCRDSPPRQRRRAAGQHHRQGRQVPRQPRRDSFRPGWRQAAQRHALSGLQYDRHAVRLADSRAKHIGGEAQLVGNIVFNGGAKQAGQTVAGVRGGAAMQSIAGHANWFCGDFSGWQRRTLRRVEPLRPLARRVVYRRPRQQLSALAGHCEVDVECFGRRSLGPAACAGHGRSGCVATAGVAVPISCGKQETE